MFFSKYAVWAMVAGCMAPAANAAIAYSIDINTSSIPSSTAGYISFSLQGNSGTPNVVAGVSSFSTTASLTTPDGGNTDCNGAFATGPLPSDLSLCTLGTLGSGYLHNVTDFGTNIHFILSFDVVGGGVVNPTFFRMGLYNAAISNGFLNDGSQGFDVFRIFVDANGSATVGNASNGAASISEIPEPSSVWLLGSGIVLWACLRPRRS